jgi:cysteine synthase
MIQLPTLEELLHPASQPAGIRRRAEASTDPLDPIHLFDVTWRNRAGEVEHRILPRALTGVDAPIAVMSGRQFPTGSHKVGPAYSCLRERLLQGGIDPTRTTLVFPSTGNYGIGGAWVGPRLGFRSLVVMPAGMSAERFERIRGYGAEIRATPGSESNVKEVYDEVARLRQDRDVCVLDQFSDFGNYRFHRHVTGGSAVELARELGFPRVAAFVSAMGSAGTIAAADRIREDFPACKTVAVEPVQCPTLFNAGYGAHAIEGIGDKHVTWIHNVRQTDLLVLVDDRACLDGLQLLEEGRSALARALDVDPDWLASISGLFGISGICNVLAAIKTARHYNFGKGDLVLTVATDGFDRYPSVLRRHGPMPEEDLDRRIALFREPSPWPVLEGTMDARRRWHNLKYFTWVEQLGRTVAELDRLWEPATWDAEAARVVELDQAVLRLRDAA